MHREQLKKFAAGKMFDAYAAALCDDIVALADRLNMKLYTPSLTLAPDQQYCTADLSYATASSLSTIKCRPAKTENVDLR